MVPIVTLFSRLRDLNLGEVLWDDFTSLPFYPPERPHLQWEAVLRIPPQYLLLCPVAQPLPWHMLLNLSAAELPVTGCGFFTHGVGVFSTGLWVGWFPSAYAGRGVDTAQDSGQGTGCQVAGFSDPFRLDESSSLAICLPMVA